MAGRRRAASRRSRRQPDAAFLNVPYDSKYEELFLAFLAGLSGFALIPHATLEISGSQRRLDRIVHLLRRCRYSFHDLSRVELDPTPPATPRFNMPFELGLVVALAKTLSLAKTSSDSVRSAEIRQSVHRPRPRAWLEVGRPAS